MYYRRQYSAIAAHRPCHERACRALLHDRLVVGGGIGEAAPVEEIVAVGNDGAHPDGVDELHALPGLS